MDELRWIAEFLRDEMDPKVTEAGYQFEVVTQEAPNHGLTATAWRPYEGHPLRVGVCYELAEQADGKFLEVLRYRMRDTSKAPDHPVNVGLDQVSRWGSGGHERKDVELAAASYMRVLNMDRTFLCARDLAGSELDQALGTVAEYINRGVQPGSAWTSLFDRHTAEKQGETAALVEGLTPLLTLIGTLDTSRWQLTDTLFATTDGRNRDFNLREVNSDIQLRFHIREKADETFCEVAHAKAGGPLDTDVAFGGNEQSLLATAEQWIAQNRDEFLHQGNLHQAKRALADRTIVEASEAGLVVRFSRHEWKKLAGRIDVPVYVPTGQAPVLGATGAEIAAALGGPVAKVPPAYLEEWVKTWASKTVEAANAFRAEKSLSVARMPDKKCLSVDIDSQWETIKYGREGGRDVLKTANALGADSALWAGVRTGVSLGESFKTDKGPATARDVVLTAICQAFAELPPLEKTRKGKAASVER